MATNWIEHLMERDPSPAGFADVVSVDSPVLTAKTLCSLIANYPDLSEHGAIPVEVGRDYLGDDLALATYRVVHLDHVGKAAA